MKSRCCESSVHRTFSVWVIFVFPYFGRDKRICPSSCIFSEMGMSLLSFRIEQGSSGPCWTLLPDCLYLKGPFLVSYCRHFCIRDPVISSIVHSREPLDEEQSVSAHMLPCNGNMIGFADQTVPRAFTSFCRRSMMRFQRLSLLDPVYMSVLCCNSALLFRPI